MPQSPDNDRDYKTLTSFISLDFPVPELWTIEQNLAW
jgi:hypothetical protein